MYNSTIMTTLNAHNRTTTQSLPAMRIAGNIPAVVYGSGFTSPVSITIAREDFKKAWKHAGQSTAVTLVLDGKSHQTLIHDFQIDPGTDMVIHADFVAIDAYHAVIVHTELEFVGESEAVKSSLGTLEKMIHSVEIECLPKDLPKSIPVDISVLVNLHDQIHISDLVLPQGVVLKDHKPEEVVAAIVAIKEETEEVTAIDFDSIEVEKKGKKEEEAE